MKSALTSLFLVASLATALDLGKTYTAFIDSSNPALSRQPITRGAQIIHPLPSGDQAPLGLYPNMDPYRFTAEASLADTGSYILTAYDPAADPSDANLTLVLKSPQGPEGPLGALVFKDMVLSDEPLTDIEYEDWETFLVPAGTQESDEILRYGSGPEAPSGWLACPATRQDGWNLAWFDRSKAPVPTECEVVRLVVREA